MVYGDLILQGQKYILDEKYFPRDIANPELFRLPKIVTILGGRRTGKTTLMIQIIQEMLEKKEVEIDHIVRIDFSLLENYKVDLLQIYKDFKNNDIIPFFVLDEIQELVDFDKIIGYLYSEGCKIFISGSNAHLLSQEISTKLRGRSIEYYNDVLSFREFLIFKDYKGGNMVSIELDKLFHEYLMWGGYPEIVLANSADTKKALLQSYLDLIIYRDIIDRYRIRNPEVLSYLLKSIILSQTKQHNINKLFNTYKSMGYELSKNTLYQYISYLEQNFFISKLQNFYKKSYFDKFYLIDNAYMNLYSGSENYGQKFENCIYKHMKKQAKSFGYVEDKYEIDFTNGEGNYQVCYDLNYDNVDREISFQTSTLYNNCVYVYNMCNPELTKKINMIHYTSLLL